MHRGEPVSIQYLEGHPWSDWSREERFFCAVLFGHAQREAAEFARWVNEKAKLGLSTDGEWDLGYEVCFYRDYLWQKKRSARGEGYPSKRTFDLCAFGERSIIIVEAKVFEAFTGHQNQDFDDDRSLIKKVLGNETFEVKVVALAARRYFDNFEKFGRHDTPSVFDGQLTWADAHEKYGDALLDQADRMYKLEPGALVK
jgi:hypothetical protein